MRISELFKQKQPLSFEIFPPKGEFDESAVRALLAELAKFKPDFVSVTYSAGGSSNNGLTPKLAGMMKGDYGVNSMAHITCGSSTKSEISAVIGDFHKFGVENVLALRGDKKGEGDYSHAVDLIPELVDAGFCVGAACYPEGHIEAESLDADISFMKQKEDAGASFFVSQLFFDNVYFYKFIDKVRQAGIKAPVSAGIMPFLSKAQISRMIFMCGASLPSAIVKLLYKYENDAESLKSAGVEYASRQLLDLARNGADGVHFYTMNQPSIAAAHLKYMTENGYVR